MTKRKFYRNVIQVVVLTEDEPYNMDNGIERLHYDITEGNDVGTFEVVASEKLDGTHAVEELEKMGSEPGFFQLDDDGNDLE